MGLYDAVATANPNTVQQTKPQRGRFIKEGYLDWDNPAHATANPQDPKLREVVGVILPPYASYLQERVVAAQAGLPFNVPFYLQIGQHTMGGRNDKDKVFYHCQRDLIRANKVGVLYPMLPPEVQMLPDVCPVCESCWDVVWPRVKQYEQNKDSPEFKTYKEGHKQLCPQQKYVFNFLPLNSDTPILLEAPKKLSEMITNLHYDNKQPDLLWPYPIGTFSCCWVQIRRHDLPDTTDYSCFPVYHNVPHVRTATNTFDEATYLKIIAKMKDLREVAKSYLPTNEETIKAIAKRNQILTFSGLAIANAVTSAMGQAIAGVAGVSAAASPQVPMPPMNTGFPVPGASQVISQPTSTLPPMPPMISPAGPPPIAAAQPLPPPAAALPASPPPQAIAPPPAVSKEAEGAFDVLQALLARPK